MILTYINILVTIKLIKEAEFTDYDEDSIIATAIVANFYWLIYPFIILRKLYLSLKYLYLKSNIKFKFRKKRKKFNKSTNKLITPSKIRKVGYRHNS